MHNKLLLGILFFFLVSCSNINKKEEEQNSSSYNFLFYLKDDPDKNTLPNTILNMKNIIERSKNIKISFSPSCNDFLQFKNIFSYLNKENINYNINIETMSETTKCLLDFHITF